MFMADEAENRSWCTSKDHGGPAIQKLVVKIAYIYLYSCESLYQSFSIAHVCEYFSCT